MKPGVAIASSGPFARAFVAAAPGLFVILWSTGYMGALYGLPHAEPFTFLFVRFAIVAGLMAAVALATGAAWPGSGREAAHTALTGLVIHGLTFMAMFSALARGVPSGLVALIMALQPVLTGLVAGPLLGERVSGRQWLGLALGLAGVAVVVWRRLSLVGLDALGLAQAFLAVAAFTAGTLYQKRHGAKMRFRTGYAIQFAAAAAVTGAGALAFEDRRIAWTGEFVFGLAWLVLVLSLGAITLLYLLIRRGEAARVTSLFYLVPPVTALIGWGLFDERLSPLALAGMAVAVAGVALVTRAPKAVP